MFLLNDKHKILLIRFILKIFYLIPIHPNRIFFSSYEGKTLSCNPAAIYKKFREGDNGNFKYVWEINHPELVERPEAPCRYVSHNSFQYIYCIMTSRVLITNNGISPVFPLRKKQIQINTWHGGGAYKKGGIDISESINGTSRYRIRISSRQTSYFISSSQRFTKIMENALLLDAEKFLPFGMPRNDVFFEKPTSLENLVRQKLGISAEYRLVLYAPTYRGNAGTDKISEVEKLDVDILLKMLSNRFGGSWKLLFRSHYFSSYCLEDSISVIDVNNYPDMQELLYLTDVLITDYSSSVWDFSFTKKPGFLFVPDLEKYQMVRDFYSPISEWPYPLCHTNDELFNAISHYSQYEQEEKNRCHHEELCSYENGNATEQTVQFLQRKLSMN